MTILERHLYEALDSLREAYGFYDKQLKPVDTMHWESIPDYYKEVWANARAALIVAREKFQKEDSINRHLHIYQDRITDLNLRIEKLRHVLAHLHIGVSKLTPDGGGDSIYLNLDHHKQQAERVLHTCTPIYDVHESEYDNV